MRLLFRQGIVRYPYSGNVQDFLQANGNAVTLNGANGRTEVTFAHRSTNYLHTENTTVTNAWTGFSSGNTYWLYWDINLKTGTRTFGSTQIQPTFGPTEPQSPQAGLHWFDTTKTTMFVYQSGTWTEVARVFAAKYEFDGTTFTSMSAGLSNLPFAGSQVGITNVNNLTGRIVFDNSGSVIRRENGELFTTEDQFFTTGSSVTPTRLESNVHTAKATEGIGAYNIVKYVGDGKIALAAYDDTESTVLAIVPQGITNGDVGSVILQGVVTNPNWNWSDSQIGAQLWVKENGQLTTTDPHISDGVTYSTKRVPIARILSKTEIIFEQGLGGVGKRGPQGPAGSVDAVNASQSEKGFVFLTQDPANPNLPLAVGDNDPRMTDSRPPESHTHDSNEINVSSYGTISAGDLQNVVQQIEDKKVKKAGDTMTGFLTLSGDPTNDLHATTKRYVDGLVSGLLWIDPIHYVNLISDSVSTPPASPNVSDVYIVPTGATGAWSGLDGKIVIWDGDSWTTDVHNSGLLSSHSVGARFGIAMETATSPSGTFAGKKNQIAILDDPSTPTWSFYTPVDLNAVLVNNIEDEHHAFHQYAYNGTDSKWVEIAGTSMTDVVTGRTQVKADKTVTVGTGGDYSTINEAIDDLVTTYYPGYINSGYTVEVQILSGHTVAEQILVDAIDLSWITITSADAIVSVDNTALTIDFNSGQYLDDIRGEVILAPLFGVKNGGSGPVIGAVFDVQLTGTLPEGKNGVTVIGAGSSQHVLQNCGVIRSHYGAYVAYGGMLSADNGNFSQSERYNILANFGGYVSARNATLNNSQYDSNVYVDGSIAHVSGADCSNAGHYGIEVYNGSVVNAQGANASGASSGGVYADASTVNFNSGNANDTTPQGIVCIEAHNGAIVQAYNTILTNAELSAEANSGSIITVFNANFTGTTNDVIGRNGIIYGYGSGESTIIASGVLGQGLSGGDTQAPNKITPDGIVIENDQPLLALNSDTAAVLTAGYGYTPHTLTDSATIAVDLNQSNFFDLTLTGDGHTISFPTLISGQTRGVFTIYVIVDPATAVGSPPSPLTLSLDTGYTLHSGDNTDLIPGKMYEFTCTIRRTNKIDVDIREVGDVGRTLLQVGSSLSMTQNAPRLASFTSTLIAAIPDYLQQQLTTYEWDGTSWSSIGNPLSLGGPGSFTSMCFWAMENTVLVAHSGLDTVTLYHWDGTSWSAQASVVVNNMGSNSAITIAPPVGGFVLADSNSQEIRNYSYTGSGFVQIAGVTDISPDSFPSLDFVVYEAEEHIAYVDSNAQILKMMKIVNIETNAWEVVGNPLDLSGDFSSGSITVRSTGEQNGTVMVTSTGDNELRQYQWDGTDWNHIATLPVNVEHDGDFRAIDAGVIASLGLVNLDTLETYEIGLDAI